MRFEPIADDDGARPTGGYLYLAGHPGPGNVGCCPRQITLSELVNDFQGPDVTLDFNAQGELIGLEISEG